MPVATLDPRWDLTPFFPSIDSTELTEALDRTRANIARLAKWFDEQGIDAGQRQDNVGERCERLIESLNELGEELSVLGGYLSCAVTIDTRNAEAQAKLSRFDQLSAEASKLTTRFVGWVGAQDLNDLTVSSTAKDHQYLLEKAQVRALHLMSPSEESLAADLKLIGCTAWSKLHSDVTSQLEVEVHLPSGPEKMPMSRVRTLAYEKDRDVRRSGYEAELRTWNASEVPLAAAMNAIKGEVATLCRRRKWDSPLDEALFGANIDRATLDAMMTAAQESFPMFRRYLRAKARILGQETLPWFDMFAPVAAKTTEWTYESACAFVERHFRSYSDRMGDFARRTFQEDWIDVPPALGKVDGAYCATIRGDESRILMNFKPSFSSVSTLAHELGHAYHSLCLAPRTELQRSTPMTLAETASIFCETVVRQAALGEGSEMEKLAILEGSIQGACGVVVDISSRFLFEQEVFGKRTERELSPAELCEAMLDAQRQTYGDGLDMEFLHPYMWAVKPHYYDADSFYNYPYMFGFLFGLGLYAQYEQDPSGFRKGYDDLLSSTGLGDAASLAARFGIDIRSEKFWRDSLAIVGRDISKFEALAQG